MVLGAGLSNAGRPRLPVRLMVSLLYLKHAYNESDKGFRFVILDGHPIHKAAMIKQYVEQSKGMPKLFYLPPYSPDLNPDETVWAHVKRDVSRRIVENKEHMKQLALSVLRRLQKLPILIMFFFRQPECQYILE